LAAADEYEMSHLALSRSIAEAKHWANERGLYLQIRNEFGQRLVRGKIVVIDEVAYPQETHQDGFRGWI